MPTPFYRVHRTIIGGLGNSKPAKRVHQLWHDNTKPERIPTTNLADINAPPVTCCHDEAFDGHEKVMVQYLKGDLLILDDMRIQREPVLEVATRR